MTKPEPSEVHLRKFDEPLLETSQFSLVFVVTSAVIIIAPGLHEAWERASELGEAALDHIGWAFGVYIPMLLGFYVLALGGKLVLAVEVNKLRRKLGFCAELIAASLTPALLLIVVFVFHHPSKAGALFVIIPASAALFGLSLALGKFLVLAPAEQLADIQKDLNRISEKLSSLKNPTRQISWVVLAVNVLATSGIGALFASTSFEPAQAVNIWLLYALTTLLTTAMLTGSQYSLRSGEDRLGGISMWIFSILMLTLLAYIGIATVNRSGSEAVPYTVGLWVVLALTLLSALAPQERTPKSLLDWTIQSAATRLAATSLKRQSGRKKHQIATLQAQLAELQKRRTLRDRIKAAYRELTQGNSTNHT